MGLFSGIEDARLNQGGVYFLAGKYEVEVVRCLTMTSRKKDDLFIVEALIHATSNSARPVGTKASWIVNFKQDAALGNIKSFIAACNGIPAHDEDRIRKEVTDDVCEYAVSDDNPLAGTRLSLSCTEIKTRAGTPFTLHAWETSSAAVAAA